MTGVGPRERAVWQLFTDWCTASGRAALPTDPLTLAKFVAATPASPATQRRRVGVVNAIHARAGLPTPGRAEAVRQLIYDRRRGRLRERALAAAGAITRLPDEGWPTVLFASRDALLLVLASAGLPATRIGALRIGDVCGDQSGHRIFVHEQNGELISTPDDLVRLGISAVDIHRNWVRIRSIQHRLSNPRFLAAFLRGESVPATGPAPASLPLVTPIDRWGASPVLNVSLSASSIAHIIATHLAGEPVAHRPVSRCVPTLEPEDAAAEPPQVPDLDPSMFSRGIAARYRAAQKLSGVGATLDDIEAKADQILADLLNLLGD
ncbi:recombinase [Mycolicibacterium fortuitum]|uniref:recombinase n=1 Tax=Mycolicibacterium fortuitum TaxID=1766 RepID=UPI003A89DB07